MQYIYSLRIIYQESNLNQYIKEAVSKVIGTAYFIISIPLLPTIFTHPGTFNNKLSKFILQANAVYCLLCPIQTKHLKRIIYE